MLEELRKRVETRKGPRNPFQTRSNIGIASTKMHCLLYVSEVTRLQHPLLHH